VNDQARPHTRCALVLLSLFLFCLPRATWAKWYLLASALPNTLYVIDTETDTVVKEIALEGRGPALNIAPNPAHPQYAYVINNLARSVAVVDLDEGKQVTSFNLSSDEELVRTMAIDVNPQGNRLYIHEMPLKSSLGRYELQDNRIRVIDLDTNKVLRTFKAPRQIMALASSKDGKRLYAFSIGMDIYVLDPEKGTLVDTIPLLNRNITGLSRTDGLPVSNPYQETDYMVSFAVVVSDKLTGQMTLGLSSLDLTQSDPELQTVELQPFTAEYWTFGGILSPKTHKVYYTYNGLWRVDPKTRQIEKSAPTENSYFTPVLHPEGKKVYCGGNWHEIGVFDAETLEPLTKIALGHAQAGGGLRFVQK
jgi:DNA-binding beta-propeller fold protein YncE